MDFWVKPFMSFNVFLYRLTSGRLGSSMGGQTVLLLHTVGRKSGKAYTTPTNYFRDGDNYILVASNWGEPNNPAWYHNLMHQPATTIQVKAQTLPVRARAASGEEYERLWKHVTGLNPFYVRYQQRTQRKIPLVILEPEDNTNAANKRM